MPLSNWDINKVLSFSTDHNKVDSTLTDFPVLIHLSDSSGQDNYNCTALFTELSYPSVDDDFTGVSGSAPNTALWTDVSTGNWQIDNNRLKVVSDTWDVLRSNYMLSGDFDIQIDFDCSSSASTNDRLTRLWVTDADVIRHFMAQGYQASTLRYISNYYESGWGTQQNTTTTDTSGKFRLVRIGTTITSYYWDGSSWVSQTSHTYSTAPDLYVDIMSSVTTGSSTDYYDNFKLNSGTMYWPQGTFPNRKKLAVQYKGVQEHWVESIDDEFTGVSGTPNTAFWDVNVDHWGTGQDATTQILDNKLNISHIGSTPDTGNVTSKYKLSGDFDVQVTGLDLSNHASGNDVTAIYMWADINNRAYVNVVGPPSATSWQSNSRIAGTWYGIQSAIRTNDVGGLRLVRTGSTVNCMYQDGATADWQNVFTFDCVDTDCGIVLHGSCAATDLDMSFDTLTLNYGTIDWQGDEPVKVFRSHISETQQCTCELVNWDQEGGAAQLWIKAPYVLYNQPTDFLVYYDSTQEDNTTYIGDTGETVAEGIWDSNFVGVYHMNQDPSGGTDCIIDSTSFGNHGTPGGAMTSADLITGVAGKAIDFDGVNDWIEIDGVCSDLNAGSSNLTVSAVIKKVAPVTGHDTIVSLHAASGNTNRLLYWNVNATDDIEVNLLNTSEASLGNNAGTFTNICDNVYHSTCMTYDQGTDLSSLYTDGYLENALTLTGDWLIESDGRASIGQEYDTSNTSDFYGGSMSSMFISKVARSASWVKGTASTTLDTLFTVSSAQLYVTSGYVKELGEPVQRTVYLYDRTTGILMDKCISSDTGYYSLYTTTSGEHNVMCLDADADPEFNDLIVSRVTPTEAV